MNYRISYWLIGLPPREATKETSFALVYGDEARLPIEAWTPTSWERSFGVEDNERLMITELTSLEEKREVAARRIIEYQKKVKGYRDIRSGHDIFKSETMCFRIGKRADLKRLENLRITGKDRRLFQR